MGKGIKGDFTGFSFAGVHSSDLGITHVSDGARYNDELLPQSQDSTTNVPGMDGVYYFGSQLSSKDFAISFAFDNLSEEQIRKLRSLFAIKTLSPLIFDEAPYKQYMVKCTGIPLLKTVCFGETGEARVYKGEGQVTFTAFYPYAKNTDGKKYLNDYTDENKVEWSAASRMRQNNTGIDVIGTTGINLYNAGDIPSDFKAVFTSPTAEMTISCGGNSMKIGSGIPDPYICIDTKSYLIYGLDSDYNETGNIYNSFITGGDFMKIPVSDGIIPMGFSNAECKSFEYSYWYY